MVNSMAGDAHVLGHTFFDGCDPIVRLALLSRNLLIRRKLQNDLSLVPYTEGRYGYGTEWKYYTPALSLKICPLKERLNRVSCSSVLKARYARDGIVSLFNLPPRSSQIPTHGVVAPKGKNLPFLHFPNVK